MAQRTQKPTAPPATTLPDIPDKLYFRIGEVARLLDLEPYVLRFWEGEFPQLKPNKGGTGQRLYRRRDVEMALRIRQLLYLDGYTISGARQFLKGEGKQKSSELPFRVEAAEPAAKASSQTAKLNRMKSDLKEIAALLAKPSPGARRAANPAHRGLHMAVTRSVTTAQPAPDETGTASDETLP